MMFPCNFVRRLCLIVALAAAFQGADAQTVLLDSFNAGAATGSVVAGTSWVGNVTQNAGTLTVGGSARDENGWRATGRSINATGMNFIAISAQRDAGNAATSLVIQFEDRNLNTQVFSVSSGAFSVGSLSLVQIAIPTWTAGFDPTQITGWSLGGGGLGLTAFRMTFDQLSLTATSSAGAPVAPTVTGDYTAKTAVAGATVTFSVSATGTAPLSYQWFKNSSTPITNTPSATTATLTLSGVTGIDAGSYTCAVTNSAGTVVSGAFSLTVSATPATISLGGLATTYTGTARTITALTTPPGLAVVITYGGSATPPVNAGSYPVVAVVNDANYVGRSEGALVVAKGTQSLSFGALPATIRVGTPFNVAVTATSGGPVVLSVLRGNATINGNAVTPNDAATVTLRATQAGDANYNAVSADFAFTTSKQNQSIDFPEIASAGLSAAPVALAATATSGLPVSFSVVGGPATVAGQALTLTGSGIVIVRASQPGNDAFNAAPDVDRSFLATVPVAPTISQPPVGRTVAVGAVLTLSVVANGDGVLRYQWLKDGVAIAGATSATFSLPRVATGDAGSYRVDVSNLAGTTRSGVAVVEVSEAPVAGPEQRLVNFSTRARAGAADQVVIAGFVITGTVPKAVLIRAIGPTLGSVFGVGGALVSPKLELFRGTALVASNTGWTTGGSVTALAAAAAQVGAFALGATTADSALLATLEPGNYTAVISSADNRPGVGLVEVYDLSDSVPGQRISNLSVRAVSGADADVLIVGVVVQGTAPKRLLIRAAGPALTQFGVAGALARTQLALFSGATELSRNAGWSTSADAAVITDAAVEAGAFPFTAGSQDSALVVNLPPGAYTAQVSGVGGTSGVALVEVYELR